jgi:hypothetical protein
MQVMVRRDLFRDQFLCVLGIPFACKAAIKAA